MSPREQMIQGLRAFAELLEAKPDIPTPTVGLPFNIFVDTKEQLQEVARMLGTFEKRQTGLWYALRKTFEGDQIVLDVNIFRSKVCTRRQVGTHTVAAMPATQEHEEPVYEWDCPEHILSPDLCPDGDSIDGPDHT